MNLKLHRIFFVILGMLMSASSAAEKFPDFPFLMVDGVAEIKVKPDVAKISFSIFEFSKDPKEAVSIVVKRGQAIVALANKLGIENNQITSTEYNKDTKRERDDNYNDLKIIGYEVSQNFTIEISNIALYSPLVDQLLRTQNIQRVRSEFSASNEIELGRTLVQQATAHAKSKAVDLADGMGVKLGSVYAVTQGRYFASLDAILGIYPGSVNAPREFVPPPDINFIADSGSANMFVPKSIDLSTSVSVIFKIK